MKKFNFYKCYKKIVMLLLMGGVFFSTIGNVYAKTLTISEVVNGFNSSEIIDGLNQLGSNITSKLNTSNNTLDIYEQSEKIFSFNYTDEYIEYDNRSAIVSEESVEKDIATMFMIAGVVESIGKLSGYEDKTIAEDVNFKDTYDTYGIQLITEPYSFSGTDDNGGTWSMSGEFVKYFKMSFDTSKFDALMSNYGVDVSTKDPNKEIILGLTPTLEAKEITENSVTLYPNIPYINTNPDYNVNCYIYRSTEENGIYERISDFAVNCLGDTGLKDDGLKSNTTYYYKTIVMDGTKYSSPVKIVTKGSNSDLLDNNSEEIVNPKTGVKDYIVFGVCLVIVSMIFIFVLNRKKSSI